MRTLPGRMGLRRYRELLRVPGLAAGAGLHPRCVGPPGGLLLRVDPRHLFSNVDFGQLADSSGGTFVFEDDPNSATYTQPSRNLYSNLRSTGALYTFSWSDDLTF